MKTLLTRGIGHTKFKETEIGEGFPVNIQILNVPLRYSSEQMGFDVLKVFLLVLLFMRYVTDKYGGKPDSDVPVPNGGSFKDIVALKGKPDIGDGINKVIAKFAEANDLQDVFREADFNDKNKLGEGKEMVDRLSKLVALFVSHV